MRIILALLLLVSGTASAQQLIKVSQPVWASLAQHERDAIQQRYLIDVAGAESFGVIIDNQGVDESTSGSNAGSNLGIAVGNAAYVDRAFRDGNYSAKGQLGAMLLGGLVGAALNTAPVSRFHYRYTVRLGDGNIQYIDEVSSDPFRHPVGVCVNLPMISLAADQGLCSQNPAWVRATYIGESVEPINRTIQRNIAVYAEPAMTNSPPSVAGSPSELVDCKPSSLAPIRTTAEKCKLINGKIVQ